MEFKVTLVQPDILWEEIKGNLDRLTGMLENTGSTDLVILPEMFPTGFTMATERVAEAMDGQVITWMREKASGLDTVVAGSLIVKDQNRFFNRLVWVYPDGSLQWYDKKHLFAMSGENLHISPGNRQVTVEWRGWKIRLLICYDLRFPVWSYNNDRYDLLVYSANWPSGRHQVWKNLLIARAIENQCYCLGINRVGEDGNGISYHGDSGCISPQGDAFWLGETETIKTFSLSPGELHAFRGKFPVLDDGDRYRLID